MTISTHETNTLSVFMCIFIYCSASTVFLSTDKYNFGTLRVAPPLISALSKTFTSMQSESVVLATPKRSPWRRRLFKRSPNKRSPKAAESPMSASTVSTRGSATIFSSPVKSMRERKSRKELKKEKKSRGKHKKETQVVTVQILPKSPLRYDDEDDGNQGTKLEIACGPPSPPRIVKPSNRSLEVEQIFEKMFQEYIIKFHSHEKPSTYGSFQGRSCSFCTSDENNSSQRYPMKARTMSHALRNVRDNGDPSSNSVEIETSTVVSSAVSAVTVPVAIRPSIMSEVLHSFSKCVSESLVCPGAKMPSSEEEEEVLQDYYSSDYDLSGEESGDEGCSFVSSSGDDENDDSVTLERAIEQMSLKM